VISYLKSENGEFYLQLSFTISTKAYNNTIARVMPLPYIRIGTHFMTLSCPIAKN
jgi:hypothetical protein